MFLYFSSVRPSWKTYANVRFDLKIDEPIEYHSSSSSFNASILFHKPDPSLGYMNATTGSNMFNVIRQFLESTPNLCGATILLVAKRYPDDVPDLDSIIAELRRNHIFVYIIATDTPNGGDNQSAMFNVSSKTNGFCVFAADGLINSDIYLTSIAFVVRPYQIASKNVMVSGSGSQSLSFQVYNGPYGQAQVGMITTFLSHRRDGTIKNLNYTLTDPNGIINTSGPLTSVLSRSDTFCYEYPFVNNTVLYTLKVDYEYEPDREEMLEMRFYSDNYQIDHWLPFDN